MIVVIDDTILILCVVCVCVCVCVCGVCVCVCACGVCLWCVSQRDVAVKNIDIMLFVK